MVKVSPETTEATWVRLRIRTTQIWCMGGPWVYLRFFHTWSVFSRFLSLNLRSLAGLCPCLESEETSEWSEWSEWSERT